MFRFVKWLGVVSAIVLWMTSSAPARAADEDDIYAEAYVGMSLDETRDLQLGGAVGYLLIDSIGAGLMVDQYVPTQNGTIRTGVTMAAVEGRWFLEPFEVSGGLGGLWQAQEQTKVLMLGGGTYLWALTSSLAARFELRAQYVFGSNSTTFFGNLGARILF